MQTYIDVGFVYASLFKVHTKNIYFSLSLSLIASSFAHTKTKKIEIQRKLNKTVSVGFTWMVVRHLRSQER